MELKIVVHEVEKEYRDHAALVITKLSGKEVPPMARLLVNDMYWIILEPTMMASMRVQLMSVADPTTGYICNWCSGGFSIHILVLVNAMLSAIQKDEVDRLPFCSNRKPYFNDPHFISQIHQYIASGFQIEAVTDLFAIGKEIIIPEKKEIYE